jgi:hypothetical protein
MSRSSAADAGDSSTLRGSEDSSSGILSAPTIMFSSCWPLTTCWTLDIFARGNMYGLLGAARD